MTGDLDLRTMTDELGVRTIADFGEQWTMFRDNPGYYGSTDVLSDIFSPLLPIGTVAGARVAEIGSGTGRIVNMLLDCGVVHVYAVEPSAAIDVLHSNTAPRADRVTCIHAPGEGLPAGLDLDLIVSIGVLHHIPHPASTVEAALSALKPGGQFLVWLYGREGNESYLRVITPLRRVTTRLPHRILVMLSYVIGVALDLYIALCRFLPLPMRAYMRNVLARFPRSVRRLIIYDQLNPAYAKYYTEAEAKALLADAGFTNVAAHHRHGYSWTVLGMKP
jgi:SAM-dependent methyltransferase